MHVCYKSLREFLSRHLLNNNVWNDKVLSILENANDSNYVLYFLLEQKPAITI